MCWCGQLSAIPSAGEPTERPELPREDGAFDEVACIFEALRVQGTAQESEISLREQLSIAQQEEYLGVSDVSRGYQCVR